MDAGESGDRSRRNNSPRRETMGLLSALRKIDRQHWFVCSTCMTESGHDELKSVFYSEGPRVEILGRQWMKCPRCGGTTTRSFQEIKDDGSEAAASGTPFSVR